MHRSQDPKNDAHRIVEDSPRDQDTGEGKSLDLPVNSLAIFSNGPEPEARIAPHQPQETARENYIQKVVEGLDRDIRVLQWLGAGALLFTCAVALGAYLDIRHVLGEHLTIIKDSDRPHAVLVYLMFRGTALAGVTAAVLALGIHIARSSFDQAFRFKKRRIGAFFLGHLYQEHRGQMKGNVELGDVMSALDTLNKNVESAFSTNKKDESSPEALSVKHIGELQKLLRRINKKASFPPE